MTAGVGGEAHAAGSGAGGAGTTGGRGEPMGFGGPGRAERAGGTEAAMWGGSATWRRAIRGGGDVRRVRTRPARGETRRARFRVE